MAVPQEVKTIIETLNRAGYEAYAIGGCVRDLLLGRIPKDWDVTTSALPEEIQKLFPGSFYENQFGTVGIKTESTDPRLAVVEVTTFRVETKYSDMRHPDTVQFARTLEEDLQRRDFTINAMALEIQRSKIPPSLSSSRGVSEGQSKLRRASPVTQQVELHEASKTQNDNVPMLSRTLDGIAVGAESKVVDLFQGEKDLQNKMIRTVGSPDERFTEDALRLIRAVRFATELGFSIEEETYQAIKRYASLVKVISHERIRDELSKILVTVHPSRGLEMLRETGLLTFILPELLEGHGVTQNKHHIYTVWEHNLRALDYAASQKFSFIVRMAALLHDVGKPRTKHGEGLDSTFYGHDVVGAKMSVKILERLRFSHEVIEKVSRLVRYHLFNYDPEKGITDAAIRRLIREVEEENIEDLVRVRMCDRIGSGVPKAVPYRLRHFQFRVEKILREKEAVSLKLLKVDGNAIMKLLGVEPGPRVGQILNALLEEVLDDPKKNTKDHLEKRARELGGLTGEELQALRKKAEKRVALLEDEREAEIKEKYYVE